MSKTEFLELLDELFELEPGTIKPADVLQEISGWSSMTFVGLIALADDEYGVALPPAKVLECTTVEDLISLLEQAISTRNVA